MSIDVSPDIESRIRQYAIDQGLSIDELIDKAFPLPQDVNDRVTALLVRWQQEFGLPARTSGQKHVPVSELFKRWEIEDQNLSEDNLKFNEDLLSAISTKGSELQI